MKTYLVLLLSLTSLNHVMAAPWAATDEPVRIEGTVWTIWWLGPHEVEKERPIEHERWRQGAAYLLKLDAPKVDAKVRKAISTWSANGRVGVRDPSPRGLKDGEMFLHLVSPRLKEIKPGAKIVIDSYKLWGDERFTATEVKGLKIDGEPPTKKKGFDNDLRLRADGKPTPGTPTPLEQRILEELPDGWTVSRSRGNLVLTLPKAEFVHKSDLVLSGFERSWVSDYILQIRITPALSQADYEILLKARETLKASQVTEEKPDIGKFGVEHDYFISQALPLPLCRIGDDAVWLSASDRNGWHAVSPDEANELKQRLVKLFLARGEKYEADPPM